MAIARMMASVAMLATVSCISGPGGLGDAWLWYAEKPHPALVDGAWTRTREVRNLDPVFEDTFVGADWLQGFARTERELLPLLKPVTDAESAKALLALVQIVEVKGGHLDRIRRSLPLEPDPTVPERHSPFEDYRPSDASRWGIPFGPAIEVGPQAVIVRRPVWRELRRGEDEEGPADDRDAPHTLGHTTLPGIVEYVADTVYRDGRVRRRAERVLVSGKAARAYGPVPRM